MNKSYKKENLDPYQELARAEEFYASTIKIGQSIPKDEASQDMYEAKLDEAKCTLIEARKIVAEYESDIAEMEMMLSAERRWDEVPEL